MKENKFKIQYELEIDLGMFLDEDYARNIVFESLSVNDELIFRRTQDLEIGDMKVIKSYLSDVDSTEYREYH